MTATGPGRPATLISAADPDPVSILNGDSAAAVAFVCEHAGQHVPASLGRLGLAPGEIDMHVGWDIGAGEVTRLLAARLGAPAIFQNYSRLVIDCNRPPAAPDSAPKVSHGVTVPGNRDLSALAHWHRVAEIFVPFQAAVDAVLVRHRRRLLLSIHSFEPVLGGKPRPWDIGFLCRRDTRTSTLLRAAVERRRPDIRTGFNQPYTVDDESDLFVPYHGEARGIAHSLIEIRNDHLRTPAGCETWACLLHDIVNDILPEIE
jgi:predicted N-formylglutamate amidohydrolase